MSTFTVNGRSVTAEENRKLLRFLRDELRLTSVKDGCSEGACGTCTVLIDGKATRACIPQTDKLEGKTIVTAEGLSDWEKAVYTYAFEASGLGTGLPDTRPEVVAALGGQIACGFHHLFLCLCRTRTGNDDGTIIVTR